MEENVSKSTATPQSAMDFMLENILAILPNVLVWFSVFVLMTLYISVYCCSKITKKDPSILLQAATSFLMFLKISHDLCLDVVQLTSVDYFWTWRSTCDVSISVEFICQYSVYLAILAITINGMYGARNTDPATVCCNPPAAFLTICICIVTSSIVTIFFLFGLDGTQVAESDGIYRCTVLAKSDFADRIMAMASASLILVMSLILMCKRCTPRRRKTKEMGRCYNPAYAIIVGNIIIMSCILLDLFWNPKPIIACYTEHCAYGVILFVWLVGTRRLRQAYCILCCPCCT